MRTAGREDIELFGSLKTASTPPGTFIGEGERVVRRMLEKGVATRILCTPDWLKILSLGDDVDVAVAPSLDEIVGYRLHAGLLALGTIPPEPPLRGDLHIAIDGISNSENVGSILRACAAFGADGLVWSHGTSSPWQRRAIRVSVAAPLVVPCHFVEDLAAWCAERNAWAADIRGERRDYRHVQWREPSVIVIGSEASGPSEAVLRACKGRCFIPMAKEWDCLNAGSSAAVLLAEVRRQRDS